MNGYAKITTDGKEILAVDYDSIAPYEQSSFNCFLSYHPEVFRLVVFHPNQTLKECFRQTSYIQVEFPEIVIDANDPRMENERLWILLKNQNEILASTGISLYSSSSLDFYSYQKVDSIPEIYVYFLEENLYKYNSFRCKIVDKRQREFIVDPLPDTIEIISPHHYVQCVTYQENLNQVPIENIQSSKVILFKKEYVERMDYIINGKFIVLPPEITFDPKRKVLRINDRMMEFRLLILPRELENPVTLEDYTEQIQESQRGLRKSKEIQNDQPTKNGFIIPAIIKRFELSHRSGQNNLEVLNGPWASCGLVFEDFIQYSSNQGQQPHPITICKRIEIFSNREKEVRYEINDLLFPGIDLDYFGAEKIKTFGVILNNNLIIELDKGIYLAQARLMPR